MKDPIIKLKLEGNNNTVLSISLWFLIYKMLYEGEIQISKDCELKLYLNGEEVEKPAEMEDE